MDFSTTPVSTISKAGFAQTYSQGTSTITASFTQPAGTVTGTTTLTVTAPALVSIVVTDASTVNPGPRSLRSATTAKGTGHQFLAYGLYSDGGLRNITTSVTWTSAPLTAATITNAGRATGISAGTATITATDPTTSLDGSSSLIVTNATVTGIEVYPVSQTNAAWPDHRSSYPDYLCGLGNVQRRHNTRPYCRRNLGQHEPRGGDRI